jgi:hypothetical protein
MESQNRTKRILLLDPYEVNRKWILVVLREAKFDAEGFSNVEAAYCRAAEFHNAGLPFDAYVISLDFPATRGLPSTVWPPEQLVVNLRPFQPDTPAVCYSVRPDAAGRLRSVPCPCPLVHRDPHDPVAFRGRLLEELRLALTPAPLTRT